MYREGVNVVKIKFKPEKATLKNSNGEFLFEFYFLKSFSIRKLQ